LRSLAQNTGQCVILFVHEGTNIQGEYKLSEDFANPYFHKY